MKKHTNSHVRVVQLREQVGVGELRLLLLSNRRLLCGALRIVGQVDHTAVDLVASALLADAAQLREQQRATRLADLEAAVLPALRQ